MCLLSYKPPNALLVHFRMDLSKHPLDLMLVPFSLCLTAGYHAYLWHSSKAKHPITSIGVTMTRRKTWLQNIVQDNNKRGILGVQSLRNSLMSMILSASISIIINSSLAALSNNTYNSSHLLGHGLFGSQSGPTLALKYASASLFLLFSFLCSSMAVGCVVEANFLLNVPGESFNLQAYKMLKRGCGLAMVGKRVLYVTLSFLLWMLGPVPLALSSVASVWVFYNLDFTGDSMKEASLLYE